jgi:DNA polymerase
MGHYADGSLVFIGEAPGKDEDDKGRPFVGKTGKELNEHYLSLAGLDREQIYITNAVKCRPRNNKTPDDKVIRACSQWHLKSEFRAITPRTVVLMGATACSLVPGIDLDMHHGTPLRAELFGHNVTVFPMFHPAAGLHDFKYMTPLRQDFMALRKVLAGGGWITDPYPSPDYRQIHSIADMKRTLNGEYRRPLAIDTEFARSRSTGYRKVPYCLSYSCEPGTGYMVHGDDRYLTSEFARYAGLWKEQFILHHAEADISVLASMGIDIPWRRVDDTMVRAYHLGVFRQSLKVLAYRLAGMKMQEFADLVRPYAHLEAVDYLYELSKSTWAKPDGFPPRSWSLNTYVKRTLGDLDKCTDPDKVSQIVLGRWEEWPDEIVQPAIDKHGPMPQPNIAQVPIEQVIPYACRDADATLRIRPKLIEIKRDVLRRYKRYAA